MLAGAGAEAAGHEIAGASEPWHDSLAAATAFLTVDKPVSQFYVLVPGKLHVIPGLPMMQPDILLRYNSYPCNLYQ